MTGVLDSRRAFFFTLAGKSVEVAAYTVLGIILFLALFVDRPFCKYLCGFGALYGLSSVFRVFTLKRAATACVGCGKCDASCPMGVEVSSCHSVRDPHCINCFACVAACPVKGALKAGFSLPGRNDTAALKNKYFPTAKIA